MVISHMEAYLFPRLHQKLSKAARGCYVLALDTMGSEMALGKLTGASLEYMHTPPIAGVRFRASEAEIK